MNRINLLSTDGRIFYLDSTKSHFELLETEQLRHSNIQIKKIFSSNWCFWCVLANFEINLFVYQLDTPIKHQVVTYENQRRFNILKRDSFTNNLLPTDRYQWSCENGSKNAPKESFELPSDNWTWDSDWAYEKTVSDGWEYAHDFPAHYYLEFFKTALVRRRKWSRTRTFNSNEQFIHIATPSNDECIIDLAVGGYDVEYCDKGFLCVWSVSNTGRVFFRENVSFMNPEGTKWREVHLPQGSVGVYGCSCSNTGLTAFTTWHGEALIRTGISRNEPYGSNWIHVEKPGTSVGLRQLCISVNVLWALDNQGCVFYRTGIQTEHKNSNIYGTKWATVPGSMIMLSVSCTDQLWGINDENSFVLRDGITDECLSGQSWKVISLPFKRSEKAASSPSIEHESLEESNEEAFPMSHQNSENQLKVEEPDPVVVVVEERSIYDSIYDQPSNSLKEKQRKASVKQTSAASQRKPSVKPVIVLQDPSTTINFKDLALNSENLDHFIEKLIEEEKYDEAHKKSESIKSLPNNKVNELRKPRSDSNTSTATSNSFDSNSFHNSVNSSNVREDSVTSLVNFNVDDFSDVIFKYVDAISCKLNPSTIPSSWVETVTNKRKSFNNNMLIENENIKQAPWRIAIYDDLKKRNNVVLKDNFKYKKSIDENTWSSKNEFKYIYKGSKIYQCTLEVVSKENDKVLNFKIWKKPGVIKKEFTIELKDILSVTRCCVKDKVASSTFAIYKRDDGDTTDPIILIAQTEKILFDWVSQISVYCSKLWEFTSLNQALTMTNYDGNAYLPFIEKSSVHFIRQITGYFSVIEKHLNGFVLGLGYNGKLWVLQQPTNTLLENYKGSFIQTDEVEVYTYENQRWNVLTGFSTLGFPTDRYPWSDETGREKRTKENCNLPSSLFGWISDWKIDFSTPSGVDKEGWQYAIDFPRSYHAFKTNLDFVRRRRWCRKCRIRVPSYWIEVFQSLTITSIAFDIETTRLYLPENTLLLWATDIDGNLLSALINKNTPSVCKWQYIPTETSFLNVTIGDHLKVYAVSTTGNVCVRYGVNQGSSFCGTSWSVMESPNLTVKMKQLSAGTCTLWAVSENDTLYFRENITNSFPEGTNWIKVADFIQYVTVNVNNEVYAIETTSEFDKTNTKVLYREGITKEHTKGTSWKSIISMNTKIISNRGIFK